MRAVTAAVLDLETDTETRDTEVKEAEIQITEPQDHEAYNTEIKTTQDPIYDSCKMQHQPRPNVRACASGAQLSLFRCRGIFYSPENLSGGIEYSIPPDTLS